MFTVGSAAFLATFPYALTVYTVIISMTLISMSLQAAPGIVGHLVSGATRPVVKAVTTPFIIVKQAIGEEPWMIIKTEAQIVVETGASLIGLANYSWAVTKYEPVNATGLRPGIKEEHARRCSTLRAEQTALNKSAFCNETRMSGFEQYYAKRFDTVIWMIRLGYLYVLAIMLRRAFPYIMAALRAVIQDVFNTVVYASSDFMTRAGFWRPGATFYMGNDPPFTAQILYAICGLTWLVLTASCDLRFFSDNEVKAAVNMQAEAIPRDRSNRVAVTQVIKDAWNSRVGGAVRAIEAETPFAKMMESTNAQAVTFFNNIGRPGHATGFATLDAINAASKRMLFRGFLAAGETSNRCIAFIGKKAAADEDMHEVYITVVYNKRTERVCTTTVCYDFNEIDVSLAEIATMRIIWTRKSDGLAHIGETEFVYYPEDVVRVATVDPHAPTANRGKPPAQENPQTIARLERLDETMRVLLERIPAASPTATTVRPTTPSPRATSPTPAPPRVTVAATPAAVNQAPRNATPARAPTPAPEQKRTPSAPRASSANRATSAPRASSTSSAPNRPPQAAPVATASPQAAASAPYVVPAKR